MNKIKLVKAFIISMCIIITLFIISIRHIEVDGNSMMPTLSNNEKIWVKKKFLNETFKRFDVIIADNPLETDGEIVKRIIALPNETIYAKNGEIYIDGKNLKEPMALHGKTMDFGPIKLSEDEYYVLGDNRIESTDSRDFGAIKLSHINAKKY